MEIRISFVGGPMDGMTAVSDGLNEVKVFFPPDTREVLAYKRDPSIDELSYIYDHRLSRELMANYDKTREFFNTKIPASLRIEDGGPDVMDTDNIFSDGPITGGSGFSNGEQDDDHEASD